MIKQLIFPALLVFITSCNQQDKRSENLSNVETVSSLNKEKVNAKSQKAAVPWTDPLLLPKAGC